MRFFWVCCNSYFCCFKLYPQVPVRKWGDFIKCNDCDGRVGFFGLVLWKHNISVGMKMLIFRLYHNFPILCKLFMKVFFFLFLFFFARVCVHVTEKRRERMRSMKLHIVLPKIVNNYLFVYTDKIHHLTSCFI